MRIIGSIFIFLIFIQGKCWSIQDDFSPPTVRSHLFYADIGVWLPVPVPSVGLGCRFQDGENGGDFSLHGGTIGTYSLAKGAILYLYYPCPSFYSQYYVGAGVGGGWLSYPILANDESFFVSPEFVFGKQFHIDNGKARFWQLQVSIPTYLFDKSHWSKVPIVSFTYGFCF